MNGRVYDPVVGRFVSPDPWIQDPENSQSFNRYTYVWNNPLRYTDPTGELADDPVSAMDNCDADCLSGAGGNLPASAGTTPSTGQSGGSGSGESSQQQVPTDIPTNTSTSTSPSDQSGNVENTVAAGSTGETVGNLNSGAPAENVSTERDDRPVEEVYVNGSDQAAQSFGFRINANGDLIACFSASACANNSNVGNATLIDGAGFAISTAVGFIPLGIGKMINKFFPKRFNPFKGKNREQLDKMFKDKGFDLKGRDPLNGQGTYLNPKTGRAYHIDADHPPPKAPHVGVGRPRGSRDLPTRDFEL